MTGQKWHAGIDLTDYSRDKVKQLQQLYGTAADGIWGKKVKPLKINTMLQKHNLGVRELIEKGTQFVSDLKDKLKDKETDNETDTNRGGVYYVNFPGYRNKLTNGFGNASSTVNGWIRKAGLQNTTLPLGHAGVLIVNNDGSTSYYEYGRYPGSKRYGVGSAGAGNWRKITTSNAKWTGEGWDSQAIANDLKRRYGRDVELTYVDSADPAKAEAIVKKTAYDPKRPTYNLFTANCGSEACRVINESQSTGDNIRDGIATAGKTFTLAQIPTAVGQFLSVANLFPLRPEGHQRIFEQQGYQTTRSQRIGGTLNYLNFFKQ